MLVVVVLVRDLLFRSTVLKSLSPLCWLCVMDDDVSADLVRFGHCSGRFLLGRLLWLLALVLVYYFGLRLAGSEYLPEFARSMVCGMDEEGVSIV